MKKLFISIIILFLIMLSSTCYASSFNFNAESNKVGVNPGDEIFITLKVSDITATDGINVVETNLNYDKSIIESVEFIDKNDWKSAYNSNQGELFGKLLYTKMVTGVKDDEEIGVLKVKIKENVDQFQTDITFSQVTSNDGFELMNVGDKVVTLIYKKSEPLPKPPIPDEPSNEVTPTNEITPSNEVKPTNTVSPKNEVIANNTKQDEPVKEEEPKSVVTNIIKNAQTGDIIGFVCVILSIAVILSIIFFVISKKNKDTDKQKK